MSHEYLWYIPNTVDPGHRLDDVAGGWANLDLSPRLWTQENVTFRGDYFSVERSSLRLKPFGAADGRHPRLYFGGASAAAERVSATEADVQLFWGEPLDGVADRISRLKARSESLGRVHAPLEFGLRITTLVRDTSGQAWREAEARVVSMAEAAGQRGGGRSAVSSRPGPNGRWRGAVGQHRLLALHERGEVLDSCLYTAPGKFAGGGPGTTWLVGSPDEVAAALRKYADLGITHFVLSDTPYKDEAARVGDHLLPRLRTPVTV